MLPEIAKLYTAFDAVFARPTSFWNEGCCVKDDHEKPLLELPREQWTEEMLEKPGSHFGICFATFEEASYLIPRLLELLSEAEDGLTCGTLEMNVPAYLLEQSDRYADLRLWDAIEQAYHAIFREHTSKFSVQHYDQSACAADGRPDLTHGDYVPGAEAIDPLLREFFYPLLMPKVYPDGSSAWDELFRAWAEDSNPHRVAHLLEIAKRHLDDELWHYCPPTSFLERLRDPEYTEMLLERAKPVWESIQSPTYLRDLREWLRRAE